MTKFEQYASIALLGCATIPAYAAHLTTDGSLALGNPATAYTVGNQGHNPWVLPNCSTKPLWQLVPNPWGVNSDASGSITMQYSGEGSVTTTVDLSNLTNKPVNGFPFIFYGADPYGDHINGQPLTFPAQLSSMSSLVVDVNYTLSQAGTLPANLDIGFDEWLLPTADYASGNSGTLEIMVLPYFQFAYAPNGNFVRSVTEPVLLNGKAISMVFNEYSTGIGPGNEIIFIPRDFRISTGDIRLNLLDFLNIGAATARLNSGWFLAGIEFGSEFGNTATASYTLTTSKLEIEQDFVNSN